jgi:hypothetical protein
MYNNPGHARFLAAAFFFTGGLGRTGACNGLVGVAEVEDADASDPGQQTIGPKTTVSPEVWAFPPNGPVGLSPLFPPNGPVGLSPLFPPNGPVGLSPLFPPNGPVGLSPLFPPCCFLANV